MYQSDIPEWEGQKKDGTKYNRLLKDLEERFVSLNLGKIKTSEIIFYFFVK